MEEWKDICGFEGYYKVSNNGRVRSLDRIVNRTYSNGSVTKVKRRGGIMKLDYRGDYATVRLQADKKVFKPYIHRLVCEAFNGSSPSDDKIFVAHNDGNPYNNKPCNLRWVTPAENQRDRELHHTHNRGTKSHLAKLTWDDVNAIRSSSFKASQLSSLYGVTAENIRHILNMRTWVPLA